MWKKAVAGSLLLCGASIPSVATGQSPGRVDTADTTIVDNIGPYPSWVVDENRKVVIGTESIGADESEQFFARVTAVVMLDGDRVAVADGESREVRLLSLGGALEASSPGMGEGPGEFLGLDWLAECREGELDAYDPALGRVTTFSSADLTVLDTRQLMSSERDGRRGGRHTGSRPPSTVRCLEGGWVGGTRHLRAPPSSPGLVQWPVSVDVFGDGGQASLVATMPGDQRYFDGEQLGPLAFGSKSVFAASRGNIVIGTQSRPEVAVYEPTGDLRPVAALWHLSRLVRWDASAVPVTDQDVEVFANQSRARTDQERAALRRSLREHPLPEHYPAFGNLLFDDNGHLWIEASQRLGTTENKWWVFSPSGHVVRTVSFPNGFRPMDINPSSGKVAGVYTTSLSVELVWILDVPAAP